MSKRSALPETFTLATANTQWGRMLAAPDGLKPVASADILLLQEATSHSQTRLAALLKQAGFELIAAVKSTGLALAVRCDSGLQLEKGSVRKRSLQPLDRIEQFLARLVATVPPTFTERGLLAARFKTAQGTRLAVVNVHPSIPNRPQARGAQINLLAEELRESYYAGPLVVAGDMNHYRGPEAVDEALCETAGLRRVELGTEPTWYAKGSDLERLLRLVGFFQRKPLAYYNGYHDTVLYRGLTPRSVQVVDIQSDHRAIVTGFELDS